MGLNMNRDAQMEKKPQSHPRKRPPNLKRIKCIPLGFFVLKMMGINFHMFALHLDPMGF